MSNVIFSNEIAILSFRVRKPCTVLAERFFSWNEQKLKQEIFKGK
jgi:hypothetical protein